MKSLSFICFHRKIFIKLTISQNLIRVFIGFILMQLLSLKKKKLWPSLYPWNFYALLLTCILLLLNDPKYILIKFFCFKFYIVHYTLSSSTIASAKHRVSRSGLSASRKSISSNHQHDHHIDKPSRFGVTVSSQTYYYIFLGIILHY